MEHFYHGVASRQDARVQHFPLPAIQNIHVVQVRLDIDGNNRYVHIEGRGVDNLSAERNAAKAALVELRKAQVQLQAEA